MLQTNHKILIYVKIKYYNTAQWSAESYCKIWQKAQYKVRYKLLNKL